MAPLIGKEMSESIFLERFAALCIDPLFHVRKVCAANFGDFSNVVGSESTEQILVRIWYNDSLQWQRTNLISRNFKVLFVMKFSNSTLVAKILLPMRRWSMGRSKGLCRCIYASIVCLLPVRSSERVIPFIYKPVTRSIEMGSYGGIPSSWSIYINFRWLHYYCAFAQW